MEEQAMRHDAERLSGVPNVTYDLIAVMHNKLDAIAAYEIYKHDAREAANRETEAFFDQCQRTERADIERLRGLLSQQLQAGRPRATPAASQIVTEPQ
jgi:LmbE family N-acetylglucosaminyl deacetylase